MICQARRNQRGADDILAAHLAEMAGHERTAVGVMSMAKHYETVCLFSDAVSIGETWSSHAMESSAHVEQAVQRAINTLVSRLFAINYSVTQANSYTIEALTTTPVIVGNATFILVTLLASIPIKDEQQP